jgi:transcriptional regulator with XRE-family HTH domain
MSIDMEKLMQVAQPVSEKDKAVAEFRKENKAWLRRAAQIALAIRRELRLRGMTQQDLACKMAVSPQYVGRVLKGQENLTLETISKLESALGRSLFPDTDLNQPVATKNDFYIFCFRGDSNDMWSQTPIRLSVKEKQEISKS